MTHAIYVRVSTDRQMLAQTIDQQIERLRIHLQSQGRDLLADHMFRDDGYSGATLNRPGLDRLRDRAREATIAHLWITSPDRLARNYVHQMVLLEEFEQYGCQVHFLDQPLSHDPHDHLLLQIRGAVAEYERTLIADRMRRGRQMKLRAGALLPWTTPPYGYRVHPDQPRDPSGVQIDPTEGAIVQELFRRYGQEHETLLGLAKYLWKLGIKSPRGNPRWSAASLHGILSNPSYTGNVYTGRKRTRPARIRRSATRPLGKPAWSQDPAPCEEWIFACTIPALVAQEAFDHMQAKLVLNKQRASRNNKAHPYLLRALVSCGGCQSACIARTTTHGHSYYMCRCAVQPMYSQHDQRCEARYSPADQLDAIVWQDLCDLVAHPEWIAYALARAHGGHWLPQELQSRRDALHKASVNLSNQLDRLTEAYLQEVIPLAEYQRRRHDLEQKQQALKTQQTQLEAQADRQGEIAGMMPSIEAFCQRIRTGLAEATFEQKRTLVELLIDRVLVANGDIEIRYVIPTAPRGETSRFCQLRKDYFHDIIEILGLADDDRGAVGFIIALDRRFVGRAPINGDFLRHAVAADRLLQKPQGRLLIAVLGQQKVDGLTLLIDRPIEIAPLTFDLNIRLIHPPTDPHRALAPVKGFFQQGTVFHDPTLEGRVVDRHPALFHEFFHMPIAQGIRDIPPDPHQNDVLGKMGPLETDRHGRAPS
jgi:site-specific DNA recombinase